KAWIAAQRVPERHQFQLALGEVARAADCDGKLFAGQILVTDPRSDHRQRLDHAHAMGRIFFHRKKLDRAPAFAKRFLFPAKASVDQTKDAQRRSVIWLGLDDFLLLRAGSSESRSRFGFVVDHTSNNAFYEWTIKKHILVTQGDWIFARCDQGVVRSGGVPLGQCAIKPTIGDTLYRSR